MKQEIIPTPAFEPTLDEVRNRFETWRKRKKVGSRIPTVLWQAAVGLCKDHSVLQVCRALRLNYSDLKDRVQAAAKMSEPAPACCAEFVEVDFGASILPSECTVEMEAPNGGKMKICFKGAVDPLALSKVFWRQGS